MIDVTVVGCGFIGRSHAQAVADHSGMNLASVVDLDDSAAAAVAKEHGTTPDTDFEHAIADADAAIIATPESAHATQATTVLEYDRHLLLEKPVTVDTDEAWTLTARAEASDVATGVSLILRYDPGYAGAREAMTDGDVGRPVSVRAKRAITREESARVGGRGHPLYYMNIHDIDAMRWIVGSEVRAVSGIERRGELDSVGVPDAMHATLQFEDGTVGALTGVGILPEEVPGGISASLELVGTAGTASINTPGTALTVTNSDGFDRPDVRHWPVVNGRMDGAVRRQIDYFERAIAADGDLLASIRDGTRAQAIGDAILTAIESGEAVTVNYQD